MQHMTNMRCTHFHHVSWVGFELHALHDSLGTLMLGGRRASEFNIFLSHPIKDGEESSVCFQF